MYDSEAPVELPTFRSPPNFYNPYFPTHPPTTIINQHQRPRFIPHPHQFNQNIENGRANFNFQNNFQHQRPPPHNSRFNHEYRPRFRPNFRPRFNSSNNYNNYNSYNNNETSKRTIYYCDTCDRDCKNLAALEEHRAQHITCKLDGCKFTAHPSVVLKHITMQHSSNFFSRIQNLDTPEEIEKWRKERRANFPTPLNIEKKKNLKEEKKSRGEKFTPNNASNSSKKPFRYLIKKDFEKTPFYNTHHQWNNRNMGVNSSPILVLHSYSSSVKIGPNGTLVGKKVKIWRGVGQNNEKDDEDLEDVENISDDDEVNEDQITDEEEEFDENESKKAEVLEIDLQLNNIDTNTKIENIEEKVTKSLPLLVSYDSSDSEDGEIKEDSNLELDAVKIEEAQKICSDEKDAKNPKNLAEESKNVNLNKNPRRGGRRRGRKRKENSTNKDEENPEVEKKKLKFHKRKNEREPTLLRRLLDEEICEERNTVLEACRFLIQNNFGETNEVEILNKFFTQ